MKKSFRPWQVDQSLLLPPSVHDFVPSDHSAHFIRDLVCEQLDLSAIVESYDEARGYPPYDPWLMASLLLSKGGVVMGLLWSDDGSEARFSAYVYWVSVSLGHLDRVAPFRSYCTGLLLPGDRKSVEPMAARLRPDRTSAEHQSLLHFVAN